jgi:hypothetical protein
LLGIAKQIPHTDQGLPRVEGGNGGAAALRDIFKDVKTSETTVIVERVVQDMDEIVWLV